MTITIITGTFVEHRTGHIERPIMFEFMCECTIEGETFTAPWHECMAEITRRFPEVEFAAVWAGRVVTFVPTRRRTVVVDPECSLFASEVI
jgi:hypothetical protein